jgi:HD-GYP domain-containing protein (c-di-GMP phosphodiesterase class II)
MARILLLGPDRQPAAGLRSLLANDGHAVSWLRSLEGWHAHERETLPDVVVAVVARTDGVLATANRRSGGFPPPLLFVRQEADFLGEPHLEGRLVDCLTSPFMSEELLARVDALVRVRRIVRRERADATGSSGRPWPALKRRLSSWLKAGLPEQEKPPGPYLEVAARVAEWADRRDAFEPGHAERVTSFCAMIAEGLGMAEQETGELLRAAMLHDIGKVALPVEMLHQRQPLGDDQRRLIRTHPARGAALLRALDPDESVARVVLYHHERPDGTGYYGKQAGGIPRAACALAVAESYDAMTSSLLGKTVDSGRALDILESGRGQAFDPDCVDALADALRPRARSIPVARV